MTCVDYNLQYFSSYANKFAITRTFAPVGATGRRGRGLRCGRLHGRAPGAALREVDALVSADGLHARPCDAELRQASSRRCVRHGRSVQRQRSTITCMEWAMYMSQISSFDLLDDIHPKTI